MLEKERSAPRSGKEEHAALKQELARTKKLYANRIRTLQEQQRRLERELEKALAGIQEKIDFLLKGKGNGKLKKAPGTSYEYTISTYANQPSRVITLGSRETTRFIKRELAIQTHMTAPETELLHYFVDEYLLHDKQPVSIETLIQRTGNQKITVQTTMSGVRNAVNNHGSKKWSIQRLKEGIWTIAPYGEPVNPWNKRQPAAEGGFRWE